MRDRERGESRAMRGDGRGEVMTGRRRTGGVSEREGEREREILGKESGVCAVCLRTPREFEEKKNNVY